MKTHQLFAVFGIAAALCLGAENVFAQNDNGGGGRPGRGNWDPAQMQQRIMERIQEDLGLTNATEWSAVQPLVQKVLDARREAGGAGMGRMFRQRSNNGGQDRRPSPFGQASPEAEALQKAVDDNAPKAQIKDLLAKYQAAQKVKQARLVAAQADLRKVLTVKQEAQATLLGLLE